MVRKYVAPHSKNQFLAALSASNFAAIAPHLTSVELPQGTVLYEVGQAIHRVYFPHSGMASLVLPLAAGDTIEIAMTGRESLIGSSSAMDGRASLNKAIVQISAKASGLDSKWLRRLRRKQRAFPLYVNSARASCNGAGAAVCRVQCSSSVEARLARWLLRARDLQNSDLELTQEFISQMLGVRRPSVSAVASTMQIPSLIRYSRGHIRILNVNKLKAGACECYETVRAKSDLLLGHRLDAARAASLLKRQHR